MPFLSDQKTILIHQQNKHALAHHLKHNKQIINVKHKKKSIHNIQTANEHSINIHQGRNNTTKCDEKLL